VVHKEEKVTTRPPFIDRTKALLRDFIDGKSVAMNRTLDNEVEVLPSPTERGGHQTALSRVRAIPSATVAAMLVSGKADRLWRVNEESAWGAEHTRSNLG
jgi:hypothetical protein